MIIVIAELYCFDTVFIGLLPLFKVTRIQESPNVFNSLMEGKKLPTSHVIEWWILNVWTCVPYFMLCNRQNTEPPFHSFFIRWWICLSGVLKHECEVLSSLCNNRNWVFSLYWISFSLSFLVFLYFIFLSDFYPLACSHVCCSEALFQSLRWVNWCAKTKSQGQSDQCACMFSRDPFPAFLTSLTQWSPHGQSHSLGLWTTKLNMVV